MLGRVLGNCKMIEYSYQIDQRPVELGGGWRLRLIEGAEEVGGGVFPPDEGVEDAEEALSNSYAETENRLLTSPA